MLLSIDKTRSDADIVTLLLDKGILAADDVVRPGVVVRAGARRNRHTRIELPDGTGVFVKRPEARSPLSVETLLSEGEFYLTHGAAEQPLADILPRLIHFDRSAAIIVLELLSGHRSLRDVCLSGGLATFPVAAYRQAGRALARVHALPTDGLPVARSIDSVSELHRPGPEVLESIGLGGLAVLEVIQASPALGSGIAGLADMWLPEAIIHGDVRADNIMIHAAAGQAVDLRIIDWEMSRVGDPAWDVAGLLDAAVSLAICPRRRIGDAVADDADALAGLPMVQATCRGLWNAYTSTRELNAAARKDMRHKVVVSCAARIVQSVMETTVRADALTADALVLLQIAENVFIDPERAAAEFFALS
ncbi:phosphotransferase [Micromonospora foliorum]|uniref:phosphotransferase n=1 Tax=Micromonospora foliorum TaxID=2911210 RepID=UPI001EE91935|nr:phosphotransferase [Micromonospora foliorum]MCG5435224.1 phosphotransferase [Micromonospora foliorum]